MNLLSILLALGIEHFFGPLREWRRFDWFTHFSDWLYQRMPQAPWRDGPVGVILIIGLPLLVVGIVAGALDDVGWLLSFPFGVLVLLYCLDGRDFEDDVESAIAALENDDSEAAYLYASAVLSPEPVDSPAQLPSRLERDVLVCANERLFGVIFWFVVLGPVGALLFRLTTVARKEQGNRQADYQLVLEWLYVILAWPAARLLALGYALSGHFVEAMAQWHSPQQFLTSGSPELLVATGLGALGRSSSADEGEVESDRVREALALVKRTLVVWVTALAVLTLVGWAT